MIVSIVLSKQEGSETKHFILNVFDEKYDRRDARSISPGRGFVSIHYCGFCQYDAMTNQVKYDDRFCDAAL